jgi:hypothetical protein
VPFPSSATWMVAYCAMRKPSRTHEQLISLQRLCLDGHALQFAQAFLSLRSEDGAALWSCTLRGVATAERENLKGELCLRAQALDGRTIEGLVAGPSSLAPDATMPAVLELAGLGALLIKDPKP